MRGVRTWRLAALGAAALLLGASLPAATAASLVPNGDFEAGLVGWVVSSNGAVEVGETAGAPAGPHAAHVSALLDGPSLVVLHSTSTSVPVGGGATYRLDASVRNDDEGVLSVGLLLAFLDAGGDVLDEASGAHLHGRDPAFRPLAIEAQAPPGAAYARISVTGQATAAGATFTVDGVSLVEVAPAPPSTPTPTSTATPTPAPQTTPVATPAATPAASTVVLPVLRNASFEAGVDEWDIQRGHANVAAAIGDGFGQSLVLAPTGMGTAWVQQLVQVWPGRWYEAGAVLAPLRGVAAGWVRIAWYASADGSGPQIATRDSPTISSAGTNAIARAYEALAPGAVQAPPDALTARVRILLQPATPDAALAIDDVTFVEAAPPPAATPTPTATSTATPSATAAPSATPAAPAAPSSTPAAAASGAPPVAPVSGVAVTASVSPEGVDVPPGQEWLRITEVMPDPPQPGRDADYEWVEITNLGSAEVTLEGMTLRDPQASTPLPAVLLRSGEALVAAGALAEVGTGVRLGGPIGNGLGNTGDTLYLVDAVGTVIDALAYGDAGGADAPGPGEALHRWFDAAGHERGSAAGPPTPGVYTEHGDAPAALDATDAADAEPEATWVVVSAVDADAASADLGDRTTWLLLLGAGVGAG
ncbi:MAG: lamin tail domain-containing protein, partial [Dehalococcoidia bacterium]